MLQAMIKTYYKITKAISKTIYNMLIQTTSDIKNINELVYINSKIYCIYLHKKHSSNIMIFKKLSYGDNEKPQVGDKEEREFTKGGAEAVVFRFLKKFTKFRGKVLCWCHF